MAHNMCLGYPKRPRSLSNSIVDRSYAIRKFDFFSARNSKRTTGVLAAYKAPSQLAPIKPMRVGVTKEAVWTWGMWESRDHAVEALGLLFRPKVAPSERADLYPG